MPYNILQNLELIKLLNDKACFVGQINCCSCSTNYDGQIGNTIDISITYCLSAELDES